MVLQSNGLISIYKYKIIPLYQHVPIMPFLNTISDHTMDVGFAHQSRLESYKNRGYKVVDRPFKYIVITVIDITTGS